MMNDFNYSSRDLEKLLNKRGSNIMRAIRTEEARLKELVAVTTNTKVREEALDILGGIKEDTYKDRSGKACVFLRLTEKACSYYLSTVSPEYRVLIAGAISLEEVFKDCKTTKKPPSKQIYVISNNKDAVKIGVSKDPKRRLKQLQTANCEELEIIFSTSTCYNFQEVESSLHEHFKDNKASGEWFKDISLQDIVKFLLDNNFIN